MGWSLCFYSTRLAVFLHTRSFAAARQVNGRTTLETGPQTAAAGSGMLLEKVKHMLQWVSKTEQAPGIVHTCPRPEEQIGR
jgi:hypothetical protein